ncbi:hypothetical protein SPRG_12527 [Saprolegnia parasitica CBS 223.65]|uniref:Cyclic nucleotide-binding domain-containing protein n=1 Tax=Saprolegnia parasitica (strain CBS 223.65) TaxID=695850 RepID=A0A067BSH1_SAPPC|nr:hypothetical protein SPRG_12527 [Saprolegnia parasitica CBS 223.65]KDO21484.1 hypothetical protein SPRG_12527 [Saprolegnia parasitica CBS 223.65]|eukprot:XP_012207828.1 hypothetical protein SPRG_12527 [Saprolegnia parasitica CBS 223.65]
MRRVLLLTLAVGLAADPIPTVLTSCAPAHAGPGPEPTQPCGFTTAAAATWTNASLDVDWSVATTAVDIATIVDASMGYAVQGAGANMTWLPARVTGAGDNVSVSIPSPAANSVYRLELVAFVHTTIERTIVHASCLVAAPRSFVDLPLAAASSAAPSSESADTSSSPSPPKTLVVALAVSGSVLIALFIVCCWYRTRTTCPNVNPPMPMTPPAPLKWQTQSLGTASDPRTNSSALMRSSRGHAHSTASEPLGDLWRETEGIHVYGGYSRRSIPLDEYFPSPTQSSIATAYDDPRTARDYDGSSSIFSAGESSVDLRSTFGSDLSTHSQPVMTMELPIHERVNAMNLASMAAPDSVIPLFEVADSALLEASFPSHDCAIACDPTWLFLEPLAPAVPTPPVVAPKASALSGERRRLCSDVNCKSQARAFGKCKRHGGSKRCAHAGCDKSVQSRGLCIRTAAAARRWPPCAVVGCDKKAHMKQLCRQHGGGDRCSIPGCDKWVQRRDADGDDEDDGLYASMELSTTYCWKLRQSDQVTEVLVAGHGRTCGLTITLMLPRLLTGIPATVRGLPLRVLNSDKVAPAWTISMTQDPASDALGLSELRAAMETTGIAGVEILASLLQIRWARSLAACDLFSPGTPTLAVPLAGSMMNGSSCIFSATTQLDRPGMHCIYAYVTLLSSTPLDLRFDFAIAQPLELRPSTDRRLSSSWSTDTAPVASSPNASDKWLVIAATCSLFVLALLGLACLCYRKRRNALLSGPRAPSDENAAFASTVVVVTSMPRAMTHVPVIELPTPFVYEYPTAMWAGCPDDRFDDASNDTSFALLAADKGLGTVTRVMYSGTWEMDHAASVVRAAAHLRAKMLPSEKKPMTKAQRLQAILNKKSEQRSAEDVDVLFEWVVKNEATCKLLATICREMTLYNAPPGTVVCYQGDFGDIFYIVLTGQVSLYVAPHEAHTPMEDELRGQLGTYPDEASRKSLGKFVRKIGSGGTFGELAVLDPSAQRTCSVVTNVLTSFICLKRGAYHRLLRASNGDEITYTQFEFIEDLYYFESWSHGDISRLSNKFKLLTVPADSFLLRHGNEANAMYFIFSGVVQESLPMTALIDDAGYVIKYTPVDEKPNKKSKATVASEESVIQAIHFGDLRRKRASLETALYEEHDVCGEHALVFNESHSKVELRAVTDVKALVMDRATWNDVFMIDRLDHILAAQQLFREMALARDNWRQTRIAIASTHPRLLLTISTRSMMKHARTICGWCGSHDHITGDSVCCKVVEAKHQAAIRKQRKKEADDQRILEANADVLMAHKRTPRLLQQKLRLAVQTAVHLKQNKTDLMSPRDQLYRDWQIAATKQKAIAEARGASPKLQVPPTLRASVNSPPKPLRRLGASKPASPRSNNQAAPRQLFFLPHSFDEEHVARRPELVPHLPLRMQNDIAQENLTVVYKTRLLESLKKVQTIAEYRSRRIEVMTQLEAPGDDAPLPLRPRVPRNRRWRRGQPTRLDRRVNRMLRKLWPDELPKIEESLQAIKIGE